MPDSTPEIDLGQFIETVARAVTAAQAPKPQYIKADPGFGSNDQMLPAASPGSIELGPLFPTGWNGGYTVGLIAQPRPGVALQDATTAGAPTIDWSAAVARALEIAKPSAPQSVVANQSPSGSPAEASGAGGPDQKARLQPLLDQKLLTADELALFLQARDRVGAQADTYLDEVAKLALAVMNGQLKSELTRTIVQVLASIPVTDVPASGNAPAPQYFKADPSAMFTDCLVGAGTGAVIGGFAGAPTGPGAFATAGIGAAIGCAVGATGGFVFGR